LIESDKTRSNPLVSVIVTTYNRKKKLKEALVSILEQTYTNIEILVVDNFSDYDIKGFIQEFNDTRIILIQNANNGNYVINRNLGIKNAHGDYIAFCDDDDYWLPHKLTEQIRFFTMASCDKELGLVYSKCFMLGPRGIYRVGPRAPLYNGNVFYQMLLIPSVPILTAVVKKQVFEKIGLFNEDKAILCQEDNDFWTRLSKYYSVKSISEPTAVYREHDENLSNSNKITLKARLYLHKHMINTNVISRTEWAFFVLPGLFIILFLKAVALFFRRILIRLRNIFLPLT
jgi:glycosyltransferase involved in cell wall biosynthesis